MIKSKFISDILDLLFDGEDSVRKVRPQVKFLSERNFEYTSMGLFVGFSHDTGIEDFRATNNELILDGVIIMSNEIARGAEAILILKAGSLTIWRYGHIVESIQKTK